MTNTIPYQAIVEWRYDGERESMFLTVNASSENQARKLAREEAGSMLEPGIHFRVTSITPEGYQPAQQQWAEPWCVFKISEMRELAPMLTKGADPASDVAAINAYLEEKGRWDSLRAKKVKPNEHEEYLGIMVLWNELVRIHA